MTDTDATLLEEAMGLIHRVVDCSTNPADLERIRDLSRRYNAMRAEAKRQGPAPSVVLDTFHAEGARQLGGLTASTRGMPGSGMTATEVIAAERASEPPVTRQELGEVFELMVDAIARAVKQGPNIDISRLNTAIARVQYGEDAGDGA